MKIRQMRSEDLGAAMQLKDAEGWNQTESDWSLLMKSSPEFCLVATLDDKVVATVTAINFNDELAWIGMMLVNKEYRGRGISKILLKTIIEKLSNCRSIKLDATPAGFPVYQKLGFVKEYSLNRMTIMSANIAVGEEDLSCIRRIELEDMEEILKADYQAFGADRSVVLEHLREQSPCYRITRNKFSGFVFTRKGNRYTQIGPLVTPSFLIAKKLIIKVMQEVKGPLVLDVGEDKEELQTWLTKTGFMIQRELIRMYLKGNDSAGNRKEYQLIAGPELG